MENCHSRLGSARPRSPTLGSAPLGLVLENNGMHDRTRTDKGITADATKGGIARQREPWTASPWPRPGLALAKPHQEGRRVSPRARPQCTAQGRACGSGRPPHGQPRPASNGTRHIGFALRAQRRSPTARPGTWGWLAGGVQVMAQAGPGARFTAGFGAGRSRSTPKTNSARNPICSI